MIEREIRRTCATCQWLIELLMYVEASKCKLFALTLVGPNRLWFNGLPGGSTESWTNFYKWFSMHATARKKQSMTVASLCKIIQGKKEITWSYIDCSHLLWDRPFRLKIEQKKILTTQEMLSMTQSYMILKSWTPASIIPISTDTNSSRSIVKKSHWRKDDANRVIQGQYDKYTPLIISREKIYRDCAKTEF